MKKIFLLATSILGFQLLSNAQANMQFTKEMHDFGIIKPSSDTVWYEFKFKNTGTDPLIISDIKTACDCTLADWSKKPVLPGKLGSIKAGFKLKDKKGVFDKALTITANTSPAINILTIKGVIK